MATGTSPQDLQISLWVSVPVVGLFLLPLVTWLVRGEIFKTTELNSPDLDLSWRLFAWACALDLVYLGAGYFLMRSLEAGRVPLLLLCGFVNLISCYFCASLANSELDFSTPQQRIVRIASRDTRSHKGRSTGDCWLTLEGVFVSGDRYRIGGACHRLPHGPTTKLTTKDGFFGVPHVVRIAKP